MSQPQPVVLWLPGTFPPYPAQKDHYKLLKQLSHGPTTIVYKALCIPYQTTVAIKIINLGNVEKSRQVLNEVRVYHRLPNHPNILKPHVIYTVGDRFYVVMPYMRAGSLQSLISTAFTNGLRPRMIAPLMLGILKALEAIHSIDMAHLGVKPGNILLDDSGKPLLSDFGVSSWHYDREFWCEEEHGSLSWWRNPLYWVAPEAFFEESRIGPRSDVWSFGITALELFYGRPPIGKFPNSEEALRKISKRFQYADHLSKDRPPVKDCPPSFKSFLLSCFQGPFRRPSSSQLLIYEFLRPRVRHFAVTLQEGLPDVDERFNIRVRKTLTVNEPIVRYVPRRLTAGWTFNAISVVLDPYYCMDISVDDDRLPTGDAAIAMDSRLEDVVQAFSSLLGAVL